ncbi:MAG: hypothetical protein ACLP0Q_05210, partial [Rhodoblastus sp.]
LLKPVAARYKSGVPRIYFRGDAGFASPDVCGYLEADGIKYATRLPANRVPQERIGHLSLLWQIFSDRRSLALLRNSRKNWSLALAVLRAARHQFPLIRSHWPSRGVQ